MKKWKVERKHIMIALMVLGVILISLLFNDLLKEGSRYSQIGNTIKSTMLPIIWGFILAYLLNPILKKLEKFLFMPLTEKIYEKKKRKNGKKRLSRALGVIATMGIFLVLVAGGLCVVIPQIYDSILKIIGDFPSYYTEIEEWTLNLLEDNNEVSSYVLSILDNSYTQISDYVNTVIIPNVDKIVKGITFGIIGGIKSILNIVLAIIISIYVLFEKENLISYAKKLSYSYLKRDHANRLIYGVRHVDRVFGGFINGKIVDSFIIGVLCYIFMLVVGFEYAVLISIIVGVTNVIPYFGPFIGAIPSIFLLLVTEPKQGLIFAIFVLVLQQLDGNVIGPLILGESLNLSSMWILLAILIGGGLFGVAGMVLGAPTLACIYTIVGNDARKRLEKNHLPVDSKEFLDIDSIGEDMQVRHFEENEK